MIASSNLPKMDNNVEMTPFVKPLSIGSTVRKVISELPVLDMDEISVPMITMMRYVRKLLQLVSAGQ